nr:ASCH domain-containing protein [Pantoea sp. AS-PWVM4]
MDEIMMASEQVKAKYPAVTAWSFGDSPEMMDELAALVASGKKTATCGSVAGCAEDECFPVIGAYALVEDSQGHAVCVIRITAVHLLRFEDVSAELAAKEGEGDLSLAYWQTEHQRFFEREGTFSATMELVFQEFEVVELMTRSV